MRRLLLAAVCLGALFASACEAVESDAAAQARADSVDDPDPLFPGVDRILASTGVTMEPCPDGGPTDKGCLSLGAIVEQQGAFAELEAAALDGARAFWDHVNEEGGVADLFGVDLDTHVREVGGGPQDVTDAFEDLEPDVLALALVTGSDALQALVHDLKVEDVVAAPLSWWSGWSFEPIIAESGVNYCLAAMNGLDWALGQRGEPARRVVVVHHPGTFGADVLEGVKHWTEANRVPFRATEHAVAIPLEGEVGRAVDAIREQDPLAVVLATAPEQTAALLAEVGGFWDGTAIGVAPTFEPGLLDDEEVAAVFEEQFVHVSPFAPLDAGTGAAYEAMRSSLGGGQPGSEAWVAGWVSQYPLETALTEAIRAGDLTRAGVASIIREVPIHYDGALPETHYAGDPSTNVARLSYLLTPDPSAPLRETLASDGDYVGATAADYAFTRPCTTR